MGHFQAGGVGGGGGKRTDLGALSPKKQSRLGLPLDLLNYAE